MQSSCENHDYSLRVIILYYHLRGGRVWSKAPHSKCGVRVSEPGFSQRDPCGEIPFSPLCISGDDMEENYVYVLKSIKNNFQYIGHTHDHGKRLIIHNCK